MLSLILHLYLLGGVFYLCYEVAKFNRQDMLYILILFCVFFLAWPVYALGLLERND